MISLKLWNHAPVRIRDDDGALIEAGYRWDRLRLTEQMVVALWCLCGLGLVAGLLANDNRPGAGFVFIANLGLAALVAWLARTGWSTVFLRDGRILRPHGMVLSLITRVPSFDHAQIASIELAPASKRWGVVIYTTEGETFMLCSGLRSADARLVAVQLTKALREMRESLAVVPGHRVVRQEAAWVQ